MTVKHYVLVGGVLVFALVSPVWAGGLEGRYVGVNGIYSHHDISDPRSTPCWSTCIMMSNTARPSRGGLGTALRLLIGAGALFFFRNAAIRDMAS